MFELSSSRILRKKVRSARAYPGPKRPLRMMYNLPPFIMISGVRNITPARLSGTTR